MGNVFQDILCIYSVYDTKGHKLVNWFAWKSSISAFVIFDKIIRYTLIAIQATMLAFLFLSDNRSLNYIYDASKMLVYGLHSFVKKGLTQRNMLTYEIHKHERSF